MDREKLFKLINLALDIQERGKGVNGFPFVLVSSGNYGEDIRIEVMDEGFRGGAPYDGCYIFKHLGETSERVYNTCLEHLEEMKAKAEGFFQ
jgi:hypothetical protein